MSDPDIPADEANSRPEAAPATPATPGDDLTMLDLLALVVGAAVASIHLRPALVNAGVGGGWFLLGLTFSLIAITAAGPFLLAIRTLSRRIEGDPKVGDVLWGVLGLPWVVFAPFANSSPRISGTSTGDLALAGLVGALILACLVALVAVWVTWVNVSPERASANAGPPWTNRMGLILSIAWPLQCAAGLVVLSG